MTYHPPLPSDALWALDLILMNVREQGEAYFDGSPYGDDDRAILMKLASLDEKKEETEEGDKWQRLEAESNKLFRELSRAGDLIEHKDNTEKMAYFRTATSLLDKIVGIQERTANLKKISQFHAEVLRIMDDVLTEDQRTTVMMALEKAIKE